MLTNNAINLDQELLDGAVRRWASPIHSGSVGSDSGQRHIGGVRDIDAEDAYQLGNWLPQGLPCPSQQPRKCATTQR